MAPATPVNGYCSLADLKYSPVLNTPGDGSTTMDDFLCAVITSVSREIDNYTSRYFYQSSSSDTHFFDALDPAMCFVGDVVSVSSLATDDGSRTYPYVWTSSDYDLAPYDAAQKSEPEPYRFIQITPSTNNYFPVTARQVVVYPNYYRPSVTKGVKVVGVWGWPQVPSQIAKACLLWSARIFMRFSAPLGETASNAFGSMKVMPKPDPDIEAMIMNYARPAV